MSKPDWWFKSSFSNGSSACVEVKFTKSSFSSGSGSNCVEVAKPGAEILVRDSKDPNGPVLAFNPDEWRAFLLGALNHEFDLPA